MLQTEKSFQKQLGVNVGFGKKLVKKVPGKHGLRWYKNVGLGFKTPREAIEGTHLALVLFAVETQQGTDPACMQAHTSTRSAPSQAMCPSEAASCQASAWS